MKRLPAVKSHIAPVSLTNWCTMIFIKKKKKKKNKTTFCGPVGWSFDIGLTVSHVVISMQ